MLRNILLAALVSLTAMTSAADYYSEVDEHIMPANDDRWVPWPWTLAQPFPWSDIKGLWKVEQGDFVSYFALKVVREKVTGLKHLQVKQFDGDTCKVIATGVGIERNQKVLAQMTSRNGVAFRVQLTAFREKDSPIPPLRGNVPTPGVMVLSMGPLDSKGVENMVHNQIMKISPYLAQKICIEDVKK